VLYPLSYGGSRWHKDTRELAAPAPGVDGGYRGRVPPPDDGREPGGGARHPVLTLVAILLMALNLRAAVSVVPPLLTRISHDVGLSTGLAGLLGALPALCFALAGAFAPGLLRRWSGERVALGLVVVFAIGDVVRPLATGSTGFLLLTSVILIAMGSCNVVLPPVVKAYFPRRIGPVTALYVTGISIGTAAPPLIAVPLADAADRAGHSPGWHLALASWGGFAAVAALAWLIPARHPHAIPLVRTGPRERIPVYRSPIAWGVLLIFGTTSLEFYAVVAWLPRRLVDAGLSEQAAGAQLALVAVVGMPLALAVPPLTTRLHRLMPLVTGFAVLLELGLAGLLFAPTRHTWLWGTSFGLGAGGFPMALTLIGLRSATPVTAAAVSGFVQGFGYGMAGAGPLVVGLLYTGPDGWTAPFGFLAVLVLLLVLGGWLAAGRGTVDRDLAVRRQLGGSIGPASIP
jgi:MFS transporter, CP family, cyanate transporter